MALRQGRDEAVDHGLHLPDALYSTTTLRRRLTVRGVRFLVEGADELHEEFGGHESFAQGIEDDRLQHAAADARPVVAKSVAAGS